MSDFTEYITHIIQINLDNDEQLYYAVRSICNQDFDYKIDRDGAVKEFVRNNIDWPDDTMGGDIINAALAWVMWSEITDDIMED